MSVNVKRSSMKGIAIARLNTGWVRMVYLDYNATAPLKPAVRAAIFEAMERTGNPSSVHRYGRVARRHVEDSRAKVAALAGVLPSQVIFTASGTEANAMAAGRAGFDFVSAIEHQSVLVNAVSGSQRLPVTSDGVLDLAAAEDILSVAPPSRIAVMLVNNETGVIQPVAEIAALASKYGHNLHCDAVQAAGKLPINFAELGLQSMTLNAHKIGGPQGIAALIVAEKYVPDVLIKGGGQEMNRRAGTENVPGIVGFGVAAQLAVDDLLAVPHLRALRDDLQKNMLMIAGKDAIIAGANAPRVANVFCLAKPGLSSETIIMALDLAGVAVSAGAACSSGKVKSSHVLNAMGFADDVSKAAVRVSLGWGTEEKDLLRCVEAWRSVIGKMALKDKSAFAAA